MNKQISLEVQAVDQIKSELYAVINGNEPVTPQMLNPIIIQLQLLVCLLEKSSSSREKLVVEGLLEIHPGPWWERFLHQRKATLIIGGDRLLFRIDVRF